MSAQKDFRLDNNALINAIEQVLLQRVQWDQDSRVQVKC